MKDHELSERELEILRLVATGASNKEIASRLFISPNTVKVHLRNIFGKIGAASRTEAALFAINNGLVNTPDISLPQETNPPNLGIETLFTASPTENIKPEPTTSFPVSEQYSAIPPERGLSIGRFFLIFTLMIVAGAIIWWNISPRLNPQETRLPVADTPSLNTNDRWRQLAPMLTPRSRLGSIAYEGKIYAIGGETSAGITGIVEQYDPLTDQWQKVAQKPVAVADIQAAIIGDRIYVPGGKRADGSITNQMEIYDPRQDTWQRGADLLKPVSAYALVAFEGKLYLFGGWDGQNYIADVYEFDTNLNLWTKFSEMDFARAYASATVIGNQIYIIGGYDGQKISSSGLSYLPNQGEAGFWGEEITMPTSRYAMGVASLADSIFVFGGISDQEEDPSPWQYNPQSHEWYTFEAPDLDNWSYLAAVPLQNWVYTFGGMIHGKLTAGLLSFQAIYTLAVPLIR